MRFSKQMISPARAPDESYADYKVRRAHANANIKRYLKGRLFWNSQVDGTLKLS